MTRHLVPRSAGLLAAAVASMLAGRVPGALACDICAIYTATELRENRVGLLLGVGEQFTDFGTVKQSGREASNPAGEHLSSSITQLVVGYNFWPRFGVQANVPIVARTYRRVEGMGVVDGSESGVGDMTLTGSLLAFSHVTDDGIFRFSLLGGLKLPTGDASLLREEEGGHHDHHGMGEMGPPSAIHGHDLALGSGSWDGVVGGQLSWSWKRLFVTAAGQYAIRSTGDFGYRHANDLTWTGGPGVWALVRHGWTLGLAAVVAGETKGKDTRDGVPEDATGLTTLSVGPGVSLTWGDALGADLAVDVPVVRHNTGLQIVPDVRVRGGLSWRF